MKRFLPIFALFLLFVSCEPKKDATAVTGVKLDRTNLTLTQGSSERLIATVSPSTALNKKVTWSVDDPGVASVNGDGTVTGVGIGVATVKVTTVSGGYEARCKVTVVSGSSTIVHVTSVTVSPATLELWEGESATLTATVLPWDAYTKKVEWTSSNHAAAVVDENGNVRADKDGTTTIKALCDGKSGSCTVTVKKRVPVPAEAVDLGLPSGLKWASYNVGAYSPQEFGDYFAWGEVAPYYWEGHAQDNPCEYWDRADGYSWKSYKWCNGTSNTLTKYNTNSSFGAVDNIKELQRGEKSGETVDDVARFLWKGNWRMPSWADFQELLDNCDKQWTKLSGVDGWKFISKTNAAHWIFLPYAGKRYNLNWYGLMGYWSSTLNGNTGYPYTAYQLYFNSSESEASSGIYLSVSERYWGLSVRPVTR